MGQLDCILEVRAFIEDISTPCIVQILLIDFLAVLHEVIEELVGSIIVYDHNHEEIEEVTTLKGIIALLTYDVE